MARRTQQTNETQEEQKHSSNATIEAATRLSASYPLGASKVDTNLISIEGKVMSDTRPVPGVCVIDYLPVLGTSKGPNSALNRAAFYEFNSIRSQISGNRPYEPVDHYIYRICVDSIRELYLYIARAYSILRTYNATNLYRPRQIFKAMGLDFEDWNRNAGEIYMWLVNHSESLIPFPTVPMGSITGRHALYNSVLFTDGEADTAQTYIMNQKAFYSYEVVDEVKGVTLRTLGSQFSAAAALWDTMYSALQGSSDVYIMAADIRRAFGDRVVTGLPAVSPDMAVEYRKLDPVLTSIMNAISVGIVPALSSGASGIYTNSIVDAFRIYDGGNGVLMCDPTYSVEINPSTVIGCPAHTNHLNFVTSNPSSEDIVNACRLHPLVDTNVVQLSGSIMEVSTINAHVKAMGTEVVLGTRILTFVDGVSNASQLYHFGSMNLVIGDSNGDISRVTTVEFMRASADIANFDWHPPIYYGFTYITDNDLLIADNVHCVEDIQNYVPLDDNVLTNIFNAVLLTEFGVA